MKAILRCLALLAATTAHAQVVAVTSHGVVVADDRRVQLIGAKGDRRWSVDGPEDPSRVIVGDKRVAVVDSFANVVHILDVQSGNGKRFQTGETAVDGLFAGSDLFLLERDARALERIGVDGARASVNLAADPAFLRRWDDALYVYSRLEGVVEEITLRPFAVARRVQLAPGASDFEIDRSIAYLVYPREARVRTFNVATLKMGDDIATGAVPIDVAIVRSGSAVSATRLAIADPASKRLWLVEGAQSVGAAFARGFLRGLLGLGLFAPQSSQFPTGIDRVVSGGGTTVTYDSSTGTLYRVGSKKATVISRDLAPHAFAIADGDVIFWRNGGISVAGKTSE